MIGHRLQIILLPPRVSAVCQLYTFPLLRLVFFPCSFRVSGGNPAAVLRFRFLVLQSSIDLKTCQQFLQNLLATLENLTMPLYTKGVVQAAQKFDKFIYPDTVHPVGVLLCPDAVGDLVQMIDSRTRSGWSQLLPGCGDLVQGPEMSGTISAPPMIGSDPQGSAHQLKPMHLNDIMI